MVLPQLDHDPAAEDITFRDLISAAGNGSDGQDKRERGAAARLAGDSVPRRRGVMLAGVRRFRGSRARFESWFGLGGS